MDKIYYENKYGITFCNNKEALDHYNRIGKQKGYFINADAELIYCKNINFDENYYIKKYKITGNAKLHWINNGFKKGYYVNMCEETGAHITNCRCKFKNEKTIIDEECDLISDKLESHIEHVLNSVNDKTNNFQTNNFQTNNFQTNSSQTNEQISKNQTDESKESLCDCSECMNEIEKTDSNICTIMTSNIINIKNYLNMCKTYVDIILKLLKQAHQCIIIICDPTNNYIIYNESRIKIHQLLKEINKIINTSIYNNLPIFYNKKTTSINFPLFLCGIKKVDTLLKQYSGNTNNYFKVSLVKISLSYLKLASYILPLLEENDIMTNNTNTIPSSKCPIGKIPPDTMYNGDYSKCWTASHHTKLFNDAICYISTIKTKIDHNNELLETKILLYEKIKKLIQNN